MEDPEFDLIMAIADGNEEAFEQLVRRYQKPVMAFVHRYIGDVHLAQDLAQEVFLQIFQAAPRFKPKGMVSSWVFKIAYNRSANELKRRKRMHQFQAEILSGDRDIWGGPLTDPRAEARTRELEEQLTAALVELPEKQRAALLLKVNQGLSYREIGKVLAVSVASVESLIFRARSRLKQLAGASMEIPP
jgi:RNA polymerase sigma-70 factor, ECF subfamily